MTTIEVVDKFYTFGLVLPTKIIELNFVDVIALGSDWITFDEQTCALLNTWDHLFALF